MSVEPLDGTNVDGTHPDYWKVDDIHPDYWVDLLIREVPELAPEYNTMLDHWEGETPGGHVVYADLFVPFIERLLSEPDKHEAELIRTFQFLERLSRDGDQYIRNVLVASVFEVLAAKQLLEKARMFFGPASRELSAQL